MSIKQPICRVISKKKYILEEGYTVKLKHPNRVSFSLTIPKGYVWDGNSRPIYLSWFIRRGGRYLAASLVHDYLYDRGGCATIRYTGSHPKSKDEARVFEREECDGFYSDILNDSGIEGYKVKCAYAGVRAIGWMYWSGK